MALARYQMRRMLLPSRKRKDGDNMLGQFTADAV
jgi:hypothetical protein